MHVGEWTHELRHNPALAGDLTILEDDPFDVCEHVSRRHFIINMNSHWVSATLHIVEAVE